MFQPILRGKVRVILAGELWAVVNVADSWNAKPGKVSLSFVYDCSCQSVIKGIHLNPIRIVAYCHKVGFLFVQEDVLADYLPWQCWDWE